MLLPVQDRRGALKARHRAAILVAARDLIAERGGPGFTADELALRADVARRTVFNHFSGLDDVLLTLCEEALAVLVDDFLASVARVPVGDGSPASMFDELATALRASDLPTTILVALSSLESSGTARTRAADLSEAAFARVSDRLLVEVSRRHPAVDPLDAELLVSALMHGVSVIAKHWIASREGLDQHEASALWSTLLERLLERTRSGHVPA